MSDNLPDIPAPEVQNTADPIADAHAGSPCPMCSEGKMEDKVNGQWVRGYGGTEFYLKEVHTVICNNCGAEIYHAEQLAEFERARNGEIPNLPTRVFDPETSSPDDPPPEGV